jgi:uncharacterized metal-binding protein YceD (DUF177 family)
MQKMTVQPEFSRPVAVEGIIPDKPRREKIEASAEECAALAQRFELQALSNLRADLTILRVSDGNIVRVSGTIEADVVQTCVVSLQGVPARIRAQIDTYFTEDGKEGFEDEDAADVDIEEEFPDMVMTNGQLDLGELAAQNLSLELDPYPRAPGVSLAAQMRQTGDDAKSRPFDILKKLKAEKDE